VVIPEEAVAKLEADDMAMIFLVDDAGRAAMKRVKIGVRLPGKVEILEGLDGGERVIVEGIQKLAPGVKVVTAEKQAGG
jgi:membrane fusion protein (multidrug efflux system)